MEEKSTSQYQTSKKYTIIKILAAVFLPIALVCLLILGAVVREYTRPIPPAPSLDAAASFLLLQTKKTDREIPKPSVDTPFASVTAATTATMNHALNTSASLRFNPYIPMDGKGVSPKLKGKVAEINARFDRCYRLVEEYDRVKNGITLEEAIGQLKQIYETYQVAQSEYRKARVSTDLDRDFEFYSWVDQARMEAYSRNKEFGGAGIFAAYYLNNQKFLWYRRQFQEGRKIGTFYMSDFNRETDFRDYNRAVNFYRQEGGLGGFVHTAMLFLDRKREEFHDRFSSQK